MKHIIDHKFKMIQKLAARKVSNNRIQRAIRAHKKLVEDEMPF